jgi:uncharacterized protein YdhG (YjbR/CyaY superfamily)
MSRGSSRICIWIGGDDLVKAENRVHANVDEYISDCPAEVQAILEQIRSTIRKAAPAAEETISYRMPAFRLNGPLVYFAAFKNHIGFYPPVKGDERLMRAIEPYANEKGNLRFPLDQRIPYALIGRIVKARIVENAGRAAARNAKAKVSRS